MRRIGCPKLVAGLLALAVTSCATTSKDYLEQAVGIAVTKGRVVKIEGLNSEENEILSDGVVLKLSGDTCQITLKHGETTKTYQVSPGGFLLLGKDMDAILEPYSDTPPAEVPAPPAEVPPPAGTTPPPPTNTPSP